MTKSILGEMIAKYRKENKMTQEELGKAVGVSTQAVSRWECGGMPDVWLLASIADTLHVSIDALFGREGGSAIDIKELLYQSIVSAPKEHCVEQILDYIWTMQQASVINNMPKLHSTSDIFSSIQLTDRSGEEHPEQFPEQMIINSNMGSMLYGLTKDMRFAVVLPECGNGYAGMLKNPDAYVRLFKLLSKPRYLDMLIDIDMRSPEEHFTPRLAASRLGITEAEALTILEELYEHLMVKRLELADVDGTVRIYQKEPTNTLHIFLFFCGQIMNSTETMDMCADLRKKPVFDAVPGTKCLTPEWITRNMEVSENEEE